MGRIRSVKPELFKHEELYELEKATGLPIRLAWIGLWTAADREGRFKWRPRALQTDILPYDTDVDFERILAALETKSFLVRYESGSDTFGYIPSWHTHQKVRSDEAQSRIPAPPQRLQSDAHESDADPSRVRDESESGQTSFDAVEVEMEVERKGSGDEEATATDSQLPIYGGGDGFTSAHAQELYLANLRIQKKGPASPTVVVKPVADPAEPPPKRRESVIDELQSDDVLAAVLPRIAESVQRAWVERYELTWLKQKLFDAVTHYLQVEGKEPDQINDWGRRLTGWLKREKKPLLVNPGVFSDQARELANMSSASLESLFPTEGPGGQQ